MNCSKCGRELRIGAEQVGVDNKMLPIFHRFGYCDTCMLKYDLDEQFKREEQEKKAKEIKQKKKETNKNVWNAIGICLILFFCFLAFFSGDKGNDVAKSTTKQSKSQDANNTLNIKLVEDENVEIYLDHIEKGKIYIKYCNNSEEDYIMSFKKLEINEDFYVSGLFVDTIYAGRDRVIKLDLYTEDGEKASDYYYESGTIKGVFTYYPDGIGFITELDFGETEFNK